MNQFLGFKGIIEIKHTIPGRVRFYIPTLKGNESASEALKAKLTQLGVIKKVEVSPVIGSLLLVYDKNNVDVPTLVGAIIKLLGLEQELEKKREALAGKELSNVFDAVNSGVYERTSGVFDLDTLISLSFLGLGVYSLITKPFSMPSGINLLYWAYKNRSKQ